MLYTMPPHAPAVVCFDLGGVLAEICHSWDEACRRSGVGQVPEDGPHGLNAFEPLVRYQAGALDEMQFLEELMSWLKLDSIEDAKKVHGAILIEDYPGALELVDDLNRAGVCTCCFSNTNALHWPILTDAGHHPSVAALKLRFASHELGSAKPEIESFHCVERYLPAHEKIIFFDDTLENVYGAAKAGWEAFKINSSGDTVAEMKRIIRGLEVVPNL
jgi:FMN phosphatase YigB (HAD superfamily)